MWKSLPCALLLMLGPGTVLRAEPPQKPSPPAVAKPAAAAEATALPIPLPADLFQGRARDAYRAAGEIPDVLAGLTCYCGCDKSMGHRFLLDCFVDDHGAG